jgi:hypothetical protein
MEGLPVVPVAIASNVLFFSLSQRRIGKFLFAYVAESK